MEPDEPSRSCMGTNPRHHLIYRYGQFKHPETDARQAGHLEFWRRRLFLPCRPNARNGIGDFSSASITTPAFYNVTIGKRKSDPAVRLEFDGFCDEWQTQNAQENANFAEKNATVRLSKLVRK